MQVRETILRGYKTYTVGIIALGQIAYSIDSDPNRKIIFSHIKAYESTNKAKITCICAANIVLVDQVQNECKIKNGYIYNNLTL